MGKFRIYDGTKWVDPCLCPVYIKDSNDAWQLLDPNNCDVNYFDGSVWCPITCETGNEITSNTEINIWFDNSGSMSTTLPALEVMRQQLLKNCLLPIYDNNSALYDERVRVLKMGSVFDDTGETYNEACVKALAAKRNLQRASDNNVDFVINIIFQNEADSTDPIQYYHPQAIADWDDTVLSDGWYLDHIAVVRNNQANLPYAIKGSILQVVKTGTTPFDLFVEALFVDTGAYTPPDNLSDFFGDKYDYQLNIPEGQYVRLSSSTTTGTDSFGNPYNTPIVDWPVGDYQDVPVTAVTGSGVGMLMDLEVIAVNGKVDAINPLNYGTNDGYNYDVNDLAFGYPETVGDPGTGIRFEITGIDTITGQITGIKLADTNASINYTQTQVIVVAQKGSNTTAPTNYLRVEITAVINYNAINSSTFTTKIVNYGNELYADNDTVGIGPVSGGTTVHQTTIEDTGLPSTYLAAISNSLVTLGVANVNCI